MSSVFIQVKKKDLQWREEKGFNLWSIWARKINYDEYGNSYVRASTLRTYFTNKKLELEKFL